MGQGDPATVAALQDPLSFVNVLFTIVGFLIVCAGVYTNRAARPISRAMFRKRFWQVFSGMILISLANGFVNPNQTLRGAILFMTPMVAFGVIAFFGAGRFAQFGTSKRWALLLGVPVLSLLCLGYLFFKSHPSDATAAATGS